MYDQQVFMIFGQSFNSLSVNVTAVEQSDGNGYGPSYLLNGVTNDGYWYQVGLSWNWPVWEGIFSRVEFCTGNLHLLRIDESSSLSIVLGHGQ
jgi:hypothetical protein